ncbi:MAG: creatininase family protein [Pseudomonadota bacterium]
MSEQTGRRVWWGDYRTTEYGDIDPDKVIAVLPVAAIEQHGPHLPTSTDSDIAKGMLETVIASLPEDLDVRLLPIQQVGKSNEHLYAPGTLTLPANVLIDAWVALGESVARAGIRKLVIVNSHGGNEEIMGIVGRELRVRHAMFVVKTSWQRFGRPAGMYTADEERDGIHGGDIETSLMLHFRPDLVEMSQAQNFVSIAADMAKEYTHIRPTGVHSFSWIASDVNPHGVAGDASRSTAEKGAATAQHQAEGFIALLRDVLKVPLGSGFGRFKA